MPKCVLNKSGPAHELQWALTVDGVIHLCEEVVFEVPTETFSSPPTYVAAIRGEGVPHFDGRRVVIKES